MRRSMTIGAAILERKPISNAFFTSRSKVTRPFGASLGDGDQVAGQVRSFINESENRDYGRRCGWVEHISVRRPWRRRGLAHALIAASFSLLRARGMTEGALTVDAENF